MPSRLRNHFLFEASNITASSGALNSNLTGRDNVYQTNIAAHISVRMQNNFNFLSMSPIRIKR